MHVFENGNFYPGFDHNVVCRFCYFSLSIPRHLFPFTLSNHNYDKCNIIKSVYLVFEDFHILKVISLCEHTHHFSHTILAFQFNLKPVLTVFHINIQ